MSASQRRKGAVIIAVVLSAAFVGSLTYAIWRFAESFGVLVGRALG